MIALDLALPALLASESYNLDQIRPSSTILDSIDNRRSTIETIPIGFGHDSGIIGYRANIGRFFEGL